MQAIFVEEENNIYPRHPYTLYDPTLAMDDIDEFRRYLQEIMSQESEFLLNPEELYFDCLVIDVIELVGNHLVVWLN